MQTAIATIALIDTAGALIDTAGALIDTAGALIDTAAAGPMFRVGNPRLAKPSSRAK